MAEIKKASNLVEALKNFRAQPLLTEEEFEAFYVERNLRVMRRLYSDIEVSSEGKSFWWWVIVEAENRPNSGNYR